MDFARKQLEKYGWSEGRGLGKNEDGISAAIKPKLKFDNAGVGHNVGEHFMNNWWEKVFNSAAENIDIEVDDKEQVRLRMKSDDSFEITTKNYSLKQFKESQNLTYGSFLKTSKLTASGVENYDNDIIEPQPSSSFHALTDDELFAACSGRTAHKGARHGLKLSGKLSRIEKQEKMLLKKMKKVSLSDSDKDQNATQKKLKKLKKQKEDSREKYTIIEDSMQGIASTGLKKKKKQKSVSFNETVTKIFTVDLDTSFESELGSVRDENSNEPNLENIASGSDEGIEQDIENNNNDQFDNHRSFEVAQFRISDLSKAERKKLKKRKLEAKRHNSTGIFLQKLNDDASQDEWLADIEEKDKNMKKRKFLDDCDHGDYKRGYSVTESPDKNRSKRNKKKRKKQMKMEEKQINYIVKSLDNVCHISKSE